MRLSQGCMSTFSKLHLLSSLKTAQHDQNECHQQALVGCLAHLLEYLKRLSLLIKWSFFHCIKKIFIKQPSLNTDPVRVSCRANSSHLGPVFCSFVDCKTGQTALWPAQTLSFCFVLCQHGATFGVFQGRPESLQPGCLNERWWR